MNVMIMAHGIEFIRTGRCHQCGLCGCAKNLCPHHYIMDGKHWCAVYEDREAVCEVCSQAAGEEITHASCIGYPDNPWIGLVREGRCGFEFKRVDGGSMDDLPFLYGEPYLRRDDDNDR